MSLGQYTWWNNPYPRDDDDGRYYDCERCEDQGCGECCPPTVITLDDLDMIDEDIAAFDRLQPGATREQ